MEFDESLDGGEQTIAQAALVRAASAGRNQVDVALAHRLPVFGEGDAPGGALAVGKAVVLGVGKALAGKQRDHQVARERLHQVIVEPALVEPGLGFLALLVEEGHRHAGHQHRFAAQQVRELRHRQRQRLEILAIRPDAHRGARLAVALALLAQLQRLDHVAARKNQPRHLPFAVAGGLEPGGQRVGDADANAMQTARETVGAARAFVELAAGVQARENQFDHRSALFRVQAKRNATAIVLDRDRAVAVQTDLDLLAVPGQCFVGRVIENFLHRVQRTVGAGVHARALLDGLQPLEHADGRFGIFAGGFDGHRRGL